ncbi:MAG: DUF3788 domain-containing protein [Weeksellaceae bacterium]|nr:DUF3788 domain-containing protein [Weeksellaceae bacterium]
MKSIFTDKNNEPTAHDLEQALGGSAQIWKNLEMFAKECAPKASAEWKFTGEKYGWSYRVKDNKRILIYLLPRDQYFKAAFVFGPKATVQVIDSTVSEAIKTELLDARSYAEGRGIRVDVRDISNFEDLKKLIVIKISGS